VSSSALTWHARRVVAVLAQQEEPMAAALVAASVAAGPATVRLLLADLRHLGVVRSIGREWALTEQGKAYAARLAVRR
jgi:DNA-binding IclR family transcriptional regulator